MVSFPQVFPPTSCAHLYPPPYAPYALPIPFVSILPPAQYWVRSTDHSAHCTQRFSEIKLAMKFKTGGAELPATDASNLSLPLSLSVSCVLTMFGYIMMNFKSEEMHETHSVVTEIFRPIWGFAWMQTHNETEKLYAEGGRSKAILDTYFLVRSSANKTWKYLTFPSIFSLKYNIWLIAFFLHNALHIACIFQYKI
jgi:hypothetical protein